MSKMEINNKNSNSGIGFLGSLQLILIVLKLLNKVEMSWWLVFIPTYITISIFIVMMIALYIWYRHKIK